MRVTIQPHRPANLDLTVMTFQDATRYVAAARLAAPVVLGTELPHRVERPMYLAVVPPGEGRGASGGATGPVIRIRGRLIPQFAEGVETW
jgi:hypothetical protein